MDIPENNLTPEQVTLLKKQYDTGKVQANTYIPGVTHQNIQPAHVGNDPEGSMGITGGYQESQDSLREIHNSLSPEGQKIQGALETTKTDMSRQPVNFNLPINKVPINWQPQQNAPDYIMDSMSGMFKALSNIKIR